MHKMEELPVLSMKQPDQVRPGESSAPPLISPIKSTSVMQERCGLRGLEKAKRDF